MKKILASKKTIYVIFAICLAIMLAFNIMTPMAGDDFAHYYGVFGKHATSIAEIIDNLIVFRENSNGRVIAHFLVYLLLIPNRIVFILLNTTNSMVVLFLMFRFFKCEDSKKNVLLLIACIFSIWIFSPGFGEIFLWYTGSINYSWGLTLFLCVIYEFYSRFVNPNRNINGVIIYLLSIVAGAYSENGSLSLIVVSVFFCIAIFIKEKRVPAKLIVSVVMQCAGFLFLMTAPSEMSTRTGAMDIYTIASSFISCAKDIMKYYWGILPIYFALLIYSVVMKKNKNKIWASLFFIIGGAASVFVFAFAAYMPRRSFYIFTFLIILACLILLTEINEPNVNKWKYLMLALLTVSFGYNFLLGTYDITKLYMQYRDRMDIINEARSTGITNVYLPEYLTGTAYSEISYEEMEESSDWWYNDLLAKYYGLDSVTGIINR